MLFLLLVKEDLAFLVSAFGVWYLLRGHRGLGPALIAGGIVAFLVITGPLMPGAYAYADGFPGPLLE